MIMESKSKAIPDGRLKCDFMKPRWVEIVIDDTKVDDDLSNFPVLITEANLPASLWDKILATGADVEFYSAEGVKLNRCISNLVAGTPLLEAWVQADILDASDVSIWMRYNDAYGSESNSTSTWDAYFKGVYMMDDDPDTSTIQDYTSNNNDGSKDSANNPLESTGKWASGIAQTFSSDLIDCGDSASLDIADSITLEALVFPTTLDGDDRYMCIKRDTYGLVWSDTFNKWRAFIYDGGFKNAYSNDAELDVDTWYYIAMTGDGSNVKLYIDGVLQTDQPASGDPVANNYHLGIGSLDVAGTTRDWWAGKIALVRVSGGIDRSADWISTNYNMFNDPSAFYSAIDRRCM